MGLEEELGGGSAGSGEGMGMYQSDAMRPNSLVAIPSAAMLAAVNTARENPSFERRAFLLALAGAGAVLAIGYTNAEAQGLPRIDLSGILAKNRKLYPAGSPGPEVINSGGRREDFHGHMQRSNWRNDYDTGLDFYAGKSVISVAVADGIFSLEKRNHSVGGNMFITDHLFGWRTVHNQLDDFYFKPVKRLKRGEKIGYGGSSGMGSMPHVHLTLNGPAYTPILSGIDLQNSEHELVRWRYVLNPEQFSAMEGGLPYVREDIMLERGVDMLELLKKEQPVIMGIYKRIDVGKLNKRQKARYDKDVAMTITPYMKGAWEAYGVDLYIDIKMNFLYRQAVRPNSPIEGASEVLAYLNGLIPKTIPILTSPIDIRKAA